MPLNCTVRVVGGAAALAASNVAPLFGVHDSWDITVITGGITAITVAVAAAIVTISGTWSRAAHTRKMAEFDLLKQEAAARREIDAAEADAKLRREAAAHAAEIRLRAETERAKVALALEIEAKMGPLSVRKLDEIKASLEDANRARDTALKLAADTSAKLARIEQGQSEIKREARAVRPRVLLVDDDKATCRQMVRLLDGAHYKTSIATTLAEARAQLHPKLAVVVVDVSLGGGESGLDLVDDIRNQAINAKVVVVTGSPDDRVKYEARKMMADLVVGKPIDPVSFVAALKGLEEVAPRPHKSDLVEAVSLSQAEMPVWKPGSGGRP